MQKVFKSFLTFALVIIMCLGITAISRTSAEYVVADAATESSYYSGITATGGEQLLGQLHDLITSTHKTYTSYDDCKNSSKVQQTDPGPDGGVMEFYTHKSIYSFSGTLGTWNREHVWCQSLSNGMWGTSGGGSDMHHIRPSESGLNSTRGNNKYGKVTGGKEAWSRDSNKNNVALGGYVGGGTFEPLDNVKGDVARIVMYVYTHYNTYSNFRYATTNGKGGKFGTLNFTHVMTASNEAAAIQMLLEWNKLDPVDDIERHRNDAVYEIQGNRNPFIDNSSYAEAIWGNGTATETPDINPNPQPTVELKGFALDSTEITLSYGQTCELKVIPTPSNAQASANWSSSDESVAMVINGLVTAKGEGTATITATSSTNSDIKATAKVTVIKSDASSAVITIESFNNAGSYGFYPWSAGGFGGTAYIYGSGGTMQFNTSKSSYYIASTSPAAGPIKSVTVTANKGSAEWKLLTSNTPYGEVAGAPDNGTDQGTKEVTTDGAVWTVTGEYAYFALVRVGSGAAYLESIEIEFGGQSSTPDILQEIIINPSAITLYEGADKKLSVLCVPSTVTEEVEWTSGDESVATVSADGTVTAKKAGTATITATSKMNSSIKATASVTVITETTEEPEKPDNPVGSTLTAITINPASLQLTVGRTDSLKVTATPSTADSSVNWTSSDASTVTVSENGTVTAVKTGTAIITATSKENPSVTAQITVTVTAPTGTADAEKVQAFKNAVAAIPADGTLSAIRAAINTAINEYKTMSDADVAEAATDVKALSDAIAKLVNAYNAAANSAEASAVKGVL